MDWQFSWLERPPVTREVVGSSPIQSATYSYLEIIYGLIVQWLEQGTFNPLVGVRFPVGPPLTLVKFIISLDDQLSWLEHLPYKQGVIGSSPISSTMICGCNSIGQSHCLPSSWLRVRVASPANLICTYYYLDILRAYSSVGQSSRLITDWSLVQVKVCPIPFKNIINSQL